MNILVTGGAGFIGSHTVVELSNGGYTPIIIDDFSNSNVNAIKGIENILGKSVDYYEADSGNYEVVKNICQKHDIKGIIHFAAYKAVGESVEKPLKYYQNNIGSLLNILNVMEDLKINNIVFSSSCTVYGQADIIPVSENTPRKKAESPYGNTKAMCEDILEDSVKASGSLKAFALRYFNPIGAHPTSNIGELPNGVPSNLIPFVTQTAIGKRAKLIVFGNDYNTIDGTNVRDFIHVVDLAKAHVSALDVLTKKTESIYNIYNIGTGSGNSVLEVIRTFEKVNNLKLNYEIGNRRAGDIEKIYGNVEKAASELGWKVTKTLEDSLRDAWAWEQKLNS